MSVATAIEGDTADLICWREFGRTRGVTEQVLELNPGLGLLGPVLPRGTQVILPEFDAAAAEPVDLVQLWS